MSSVIKNKGRTSAVAPPEGQIEVQNRRSPVAPPEGQKGVLNRTASRLSDQVVEGKHAVLYRYKRNLPPSPEIRCRENVLRFFYPRLVPSALKSHQGDETRIGELKRAKQRRDIFLLAFHNVQQLPPDDIWSYHQISGIHGLPHEPYDGAAGDWQPGENRWGGYCEHGSPLFPTWHRPYVLLMEQSIIRQARLLADTLIEDAHEKEDVRRIIDEDLCIPYWDWADYSTQLFGVPDVFTSIEISMSYNWRSFKTRKIPNPLKSFVLPKDLGVSYASSDVYNPAAKPHYVVPSEGIPFTPGGYPTVRHVNSAYVSQNDKLHLTVIRNAGSTLVEGIYSMFRHKDWLSFSNHYSYVDSEKNHPYGHYSSLELVHDVVHDAVGGTGGQMAYPELAGFDPIFYFHHSNVDRLVALWQFCYPDKWIDDDPQKIYGGTFTIEPYTTATSDTNLTPFRRSDKEGQFVSSNDVRIVDEDIGYTYPELEKARKEEWSPAKMLIYVLDKYQPPEHFVHNWYVVLERIRKRIFHGIYDIRVFLDKSDATANTPLSDPHYAGHIFVFGRSNIAWCANCESRGFMRGSLNITKTMIQLGISIAPEMLDDIPRTPEVIPTTATEDTFGLVKAITLVYVDGTGNQLYPEDVGWEEGPDIFIYYQEGIKDQEDIDYFRQQHEIKKLSPPDISAGKVIIFKKPDEKGIGVQNTRI